MKKVLLQLDTDEHPSPFDAIVAHDADVDVLLSHGGVQPDGVRALVQDAFFTRGMDDLKTMAVWVGGKRVRLGEEILAQVQKAFFGPFRVSVMLDCNGCNTTAATTIARIAKARSLSGSRALVLGLGAVGLRSAVLLQGEGCEVTAASLPADLFDDDRPYHRPHGLGVAEELGLNAREPSDRAELEGLLDDAQIVLCAGPSGVEVLREDVWRKHPSGRTAGRLQRGRAAGHRRHEGDRRPRGLRRQAGTRRAGDRGPEDEGAQGLRPAAVREQRPRARHRRGLRDRQGARLTRVAGVDPGTVSFDICGLDGGEVVFERSFRTADVGADPALLVDALVEGGPFELVLGPAGYGLPLVPVEQVGERELALMLLVREDEPEGRVGVGGMRSIIRALIAARLPLVFGPGAIHLPTIPDYRKWNRIDLGTADKVASVALGIADQAQRLGVDVAETSFVMLELGGAFSAALAVDGGRIVDGCGGSSGPIGARACGAMDAEVAYLIGAALSKRTVFSGGALDSPDGRLALEEGAAKAALALTVSAPAPREILLTGRLAPDMVEALGARLAHVAPVRLAAGAKAAAHGAAMLADGLAGGRYAALVERLGVRDASGSALDHLRIHGAESIRLR